MKRTLMLLLACCTLAAWLTPTRAQVDTVPAPIERTLVQLTVTAGFADPSRTLPQRRQLGERMTPLTNRLLAVFMSQAATLNKVQVSERSEEIPMAMGITTTVIQGQRVSFHACSVFRSSAALHRVRSVSREWLPLAASSNPP